MKKLILITILLLSAAQIIAKPLIIVSGNPLKMIVSELAGNSAEVINILPAGASPHTYSLKPSDAKRIMKADAVIIVEKHFDGWAVKSNAGRLISVFPLLPEKYHTDMHAGACDHGHDADMHFWTDPLAVKQILQPLAKQLIETGIDKKVIEKNLSKFSTGLERLDSDISKLSKPLKGKSFVMHHPSLVYFFKRYGIGLTGLIESSPGGEISPRELAGLIKKANKDKALAIISEPQLPAKPVNIFSKESGLPVIEINPLGDEFDNYSQFILSIANKLQSVNE
jgi:zinc transport system substrate-binding protein